MKTFMDKDFMLQTQTASSLFHDFAEKTPILDYHCHINPAEIANNRKFDTGMAWRRSLQMAFYAFLRD